MHPYTSRRVGFVLMLLVTVGLPLVAAQERRQIQVDPKRAGQLYVSADPVDHSPGRDFKRDVDGKAEIDGRYAEASRGVMDFQKISYRSSVGDLDIPAYLFQPLNKRGPRGHAAMIWVHGGVHGNWGIGMFPFVREAVERGYVIIAPEYRGSTGYGEAFHKEIDYGGYEVDDTMTAVDVAPSRCRTVRSRGPMRGGRFGSVV